MITFVVYDSTGRIMRTGTCQHGDMPLQAGAGESVMEGRANDVLEHVVDGVIMPRPDMPVLIDTTTVPADGIAVVTITGIPVGASVRVSGPASDAFTVDDGSAELTFDVPGAYRVTIERFPYRDFEATINAA